MANLHASLTTENADKHFLIVAQYDRPFSPVEYAARMSISYAEKLAEKLLLDPKCIAVTVFEVANHKTIAHAYWPEENLPYD